MIGIYVLFDNNVGFLTPFEFDDHKNILNEFLMPCTEQLITIRMRLRARVYRRKIKDKDDIKSDNNNNPASPTSAISDDSEENKPVITDKSDRFLAKHFDEFATQSRMNLKHNVEMSVSYNYSSDDGSNNTNNNSNNTQNTNNSSHKSKSSLDTPTKTGIANKKKPHGTSPSSVSLSESNDYYSDESDWDTIQRNTHLRMMESFLQSGYNFPPDEVSLYLCIYIH